MRQAVFSSLAQRIEGARFFDLFAGSGAYGLEALSRGALSGVFVEKNPRAIKVLRENIAAVCKSVGCQPRDTAQILSTDVLNAPLGMAEAPDLVFIDPPWDAIPGLSGEIFCKLDEVLSKVDDPIVIFEMPGELVLEPAGWVSVKRLGGKGSRQPAAVFFRRACN
jgi:16S rRNA (guanine966-N2)-methyltransferase